MPRPPLRPHPDDDASVPGRRGLLLAAAGALLGGCAGLGLAPQFTLTEARLQALVERQFPRRHRLLELFDVTLAAPRLTLLPERDRLAADWPLEVADRFGGTPRRGRLQLDSGLRLEPSDFSLHLRQVTVQRVALDGVLPVSLQALGAAIAERLLEDLPVYRMSDERLQQFRSLGFTGGRVTIGGQGVEIALHRQAPPPPQAAPFGLPR
ncbi:DUF1439 domain-containing protein [Aquabacterium sp. J223]|uniref:DUF1439 domain-containing protein n=1 Tax=Aquabacterium sp. J223 TaxID=2898431 RepID=UPI0021AD7F15|nr:DUF1439 domain-containing protein [Aquabacterium sp. J223]UUX95041.1 DUF1439 domain-containing protein [Aquabacterium sp. J223]